MNILQRIFAPQKPSFKYDVSEETHNLLFDWFNESKISIKKFETEYFEPIVKAYRTLENENKYFEDFYEIAQKDYYLKFGFMYLMYHYTNNDLLKRFFELKDNIRLQEAITHWHSHAGLDHAYPELFLPLNIGSQIAMYYHAIHARIDTSISFLPCNFAYLKFRNDETYFNTIFNYVTNQTFEEKPYLLFLLHKSTTQKHEYGEDENGYQITTNIKTITTSPYDELINVTFENSIKEYNQLHKSNLSKEMFLILGAFLLHKSVDKKTKLTIDNFEEAQILINKTKGAESLILEHIIYFLKNEHLFERDRYWQMLLTSMCEDKIFTIDWIEDKIDVLLPENKADSFLLNIKVKNSQLIFEYIITPLFQNIVSQLSYNDPIVQKYEVLLFNLTKISPYQKGLEILRTLAKNTIEDKSECTFVLSKLSSFYYQSYYFGDSHLFYDETDKSFTTIKNFIDDLNNLVPIALKKVNKPLNYVNNNDYFFIINHAGKDIEIYPYNFVEDINKLLKNVDSPYRLVAIPLILKEAGTSKYRNILFSLAFMNENEYHYFNQKYIIKKKLGEWRVTDYYKDNAEWFKSGLTTSKTLHPVFTHQTDLSFEDFKQVKQNNITERIIDNAFLSDINWEWFKIKYINELSSKEQWYQIMNVICQCSKGKKPTTSWIADLQKQIEKLGTEKYFKELQVLVSLSINEESWFFDVYANAFKGLMWSCAYINPNDLSLSILKTIAEHCYTKIYGVGAKSTAMGNLALEALVATKKEEAFGILNIMRSKTKYNKFAVAIEKSIDKFKENSTIPEQLLADKSIPSFGFEGGKKNFEIADYKVIVTFQKKKLIKQYEDNEGNSLKQLPSDISDDNTKILKEINEEIKQINSVFNDLGKRIKTYWLYDRIWSFSDWNYFIKNHDLIYPHIESLIWTNKTQKKDFIVRNNQLLGIDNEAFISNPEDEIFLWHPVVNSEDNIRQWQYYLWTNNIIQSQRQAYRENYPFSKTELELSETPRFAHHFLEVQKLMALANNTGWIFTYEHEGVNWPRIYLKTLNITAHLSCDYDRHSYAIPTKQLYFTFGNSTKINDYNPKQTFEKIKLSEIPLITLSELCRDIDLFIATTSIANNIELSENRQEYEAYKTEYQNGLFSDNANIPVRRQIIEQIAPGLKLNIVKFEGNYVIINGKKDNYKVNLNSGFAQLYDTQQHINLIPDIKKLKSDKKLRLPIEDDETLYIILAKIIYLQKM